MMTWTAWRCEAAWIIEIYISHWQQRIKADCANRNFSGKLQLELARIMSSVARSGSLSSGCLLLCDLQSGQLSTCNHHACLGG